MSTDASEAARLLARLPRRRGYHGTCPVCGAAFNGTATRRYCSRTCRLHAAYLRRKAARQARRQTHVPEVND